MEVQKTLLMEKSDYGRSPEKCRARVMDRDKVLVSADDRFAYGGL